MIQLYQDPLSAWIETLPIPPAKTYGWSTLEVLNAPIVDSFERVGMKGFE